MNEFEQKLQRQPLRQVPDEWREEILAAAGNAQAAPVPCRSFPATFWERLSALLWPNQLAWGGLAAVWVVILALHFSMQEEMPVVAQKESRPVAEIIVDWRNNQRLLAELIGSHKSDVADRPKMIAPQPRSQCVELLVA